MELFSCNYMKMPLNSCVIGVSRLLASLIIYLFSFGVLGAQKISYNLGARTGTFDIDTSRVAKPIYLLKSKRFLPFDAEKDENFFCGAKESHKSHLLYHLSPPRELSEAEVSQYKFSTPEAALSLIQNNPEWRLNTPWLSTYAYPRLYVVLRDKKSKKYYSYRILIWEIAVYPGADCP